MYRSGRPGVLARIMNRISAIQFSAGLVSPKRAATVEVVGRRTGRLVSFPVVVTDYDGDRYLVAMLGNNANWVRNVRAANGIAVLRRGRREPVRLEEVDLGARAPILHRYLALAPGARPHLPVDRRAPLEEFERISAQFPVFRITRRRRARATPEAERSERSQRRRTGLGRPAIKTPETPMRSQASAERPAKAQPARRTKVRNSSLGNVRSATKTAIASVTRPPSQSAAPRR